MKKYVLLLPTVIYACILELCMLYVFLSEVDNENEIVGCIIGVVLFGTFVAGVACNIVAGIKAVKNKWDVKELLRANLILKYIQLPLNVCFLVGCIGGMVMLMLSYTIWGFGSSYGAGFIRSFLLIGVCSLAAELFGGMIHSGPLAIAGVIRVKSIGVISKRAAVICGVASFVVPVDIVVSHWLYKKVKNIH